MPVDNRYTCVSGRVNVVPTGLLGALTGYITTTYGFPLRFRQVVGPSGGPISVATVDGQVATLCGYLLSERGEAILNVSSVTPSGSPPNPWPHSFDNWMVLPIYVLVPAQLSALLGLGGWSGGGSPFGGTGCGGGDWLGNSNPYSSGGLFGGTGFGSSSGFGDEVAGLLQRLGQRQGFSF